MFCNKIDTHLRSKKTASGWPVIGTKLLLLMLPNSFG